MGFIAHHPSWPWDRRLPEVPGRAETGDKRLWSWQATSGPPLGSGPGSGSSSCLRGPRTLVLQDGLDSPLDGPPAWGAPGVQRAATELPPPGAPSLSDSVCTDLWSPPPPGGPRPVTQVTELAWAYLPREGQHPGAEFTPEVASTAPETRGIEEMKQERKHYLGTLTLAPELGKPSWVGAFGRELTYSRAGQWVQVWGALWGGWGCWLGGGRQTTAGGRAGLQPPPWPGPLVALPPSSKHLTGRLLPLGDSEWSWFSAKWLHAAAVRAFGARCASSRRPLSIFRALWAECWVEPGLPPRPLGGCTGAICVLFGASGSWRLRGPDVPSDVLGMPLAKDAGGWGWRQLLFPAGKLWSGRERKGCAQDG